MVGGDDMLVQCWPDVGVMLVQLGPDIGLMLVQCWPDVGRRCERMRVSVAH